MTIENVLSLLGWSMVINFGILAIWALAMKLAPELLYRTQSMFTTLPREQIEKSLYLLAGQYKMAILLTHFGPYCALRIVF